MNKSRYNFIDMPNDAKVRQVVAYQPEQKIYPKWKFWRNQKLKTKFAILTEDGMLFIFDPDTGDIKVDGTELK